MFCMTVHLGGVVIKLSMMKVLILLFFSEQGWVFAAQVDPGNHYGGSAIATGKSPHDLCAESSLCLCLQHTSTAVWAL